MIETESLHSAECLPTYYWELVHTLIAVESFRDAAAVVQFTFDPDEAVES